MQRGAQLSLGSVFIDPRLLPKERLAACFRSVLKRSGLQDGDDTAGFLPLRAEIARRLRKRGISVEAEHIVTTVGSQQVLDLVLRSLERPTIATENPAYHFGKALFERSSVELFGLPVDPFVGADLAAWRRALEARRPGLVYVTTHFQNPTGYSLDHARRWPRALDRAPSPRVTAGPRGTLGRSWRRVVAFG